MNSNLYKDQQALAFQALMSDKIKTEGINKKNDTSVLSQLTNLLIPVGTLAALAYGTHKYGPYAASRVKRLLSIAEQKADIEKAFVKGIKPSPKVSAKDIEEVLRMADSNPEFAFDVLKRSKDLQGWEEPMIPGFESLFKRGL